MSMTQRKRPAAQAQDPNNEDNETISYTDHNTSLSNTTPLSSSPNTAPPPKFTLMEELILLGLKDNEGLLSFWNDTISYVLRATILLELSLRSRIYILKEKKKREVCDRIVVCGEVEPMTGEVLLDESMRYIKGDSESVTNWIDLLSGMLTNW